MTVDAALAPNGGPNGANAANAHTGAVAAAAPAAEEGHARADSGAGDQPRVAADSGSGTGADAGEGVPFMHSGSHQHPQQQPQQQQQYQHSDPVMGTDAGAGAGVGVGTEGLRRAGEDAALGASITTSDNTAAPHYHQQPQQPHPYPYTYPTSAVGAVSPIADGSASEQPPNTTNTSLLAMLSPPAYGSSGGGGGGEGLGMATDNLSSGSNSPPLPIPILGANNISNRTGPAYPPAAPHFANEHGHGYLAADSGPPGVSEQYQLLGGPQSQNMGGGGENIDGDWAVWDNPPPQQQQTHQSSTTHRLVHTGFGGLAGAGSGGGSSSGYPLYDPQRYGGSSSSQVLHENTTINNILGVPTTNTNNTTTTTSGMMHPQLATDPAFSAFALGSPPMPPLVGGQLSSGPSSPPGLVDGGDVNLYPLLASPPHGAHADQDGSSNLIAHILAQPSAQGAGHARFSDEDDAHTTTTTTTAHPHPGDQDTMHTAYPHWGEQQITHTAHPHPGDQQTTLSAAFGRIGGSRCTNTYSSKQRKPKYPLGSAGALSSLPMPASVPGVLNSFGLYSSPKAARSHRHHHSNGYHQHEDLAHNLYYYQQGGHDFNLTAGRQGSVSDDSVKVNAGDSGDDEDSDDPDYDPVNSDSDQESGFGREKGRGGYGAGAWGATRRSSTPSNEGLGDRVGDISLQGDVCCFCACVFILCMYVCRGFWRAEIFFHSGLWIQIGSGHHSWPILEGGKRWFAAVPAVVVRGPIVSVDHARLSVLVAHPVRIRMRAHG